MELTSKHVHALVYHPWSDCLMWNWCEAMKKRQPRVISRKELKEILDFMHRHYWIFYKDGKLSVFRQPNHLPHRGLLEKYGWVEL